MESESASVQTGQPLSVPNVSGNKGPFWHAITQKAWTKIHKKMSFPSLTYIVRTIPVSQTEVILTLMHSYTDNINMDFSVCQRAFHNKERKIAEMKDAQSQTLCSRYWQPGNSTKFSLIFITVLYESLPRGPVSDSDSADLISFQQLTVNSRISIACD